MIADETNESGRNYPFFSHFKIALATVIIRSTPKEITAQEYAIILAQKLQTSEETWKKKAEDLEKKLLVANQEVVYLRLKHEDKSEADEVISDVPKTCGLNETEVTRNVQFMKTVAALKWHEKSNTTQIVVDEENVIKESIVKAVQALNDSMRQLELNERLISVLEENIGVLERLLTKQSLLSDEGGIKQHIVLLMEGLLRMIMNQKSAGDYHAQERLSSMAAKLGANHAVVHIVLSKIMILIKTYCEMLADNQKKLELVQTDKFENMYYVLWTMESILKNSEADHNILHSVKEEIQEIVRENVSGIVETFPIFAHYIWKLMAITEEREFSNNSNQRNLWLKQQDCLIR